MTWRSAPDAGWIALIVFALALVIASLALRCTPARSAADVDVERCLAAADAWAELQIAQRCDTETFAVCPEHDAIMTEWERRARRCR